LRNRIGSTRVLSRNACAVGVTNATRTGITARQACGARKTLNSTWHGSSFSALPEDGGR
jgi:hypothetical protein